MSGNAVMISDLSDYELDAVAAGTRVIRSFNGNNVAIVAAPTFSPSINLSRLRGDSNSVTQGSANGSQVAIDQSN